MQKIDGQPSVETWYSVVVCAILSYSNAICIGWLASAAVLLIELEAVYKDTPFVEAQAGSVVALTGGLSCIAIFLGVVSARHLGVKIVGIVSTLLVAASNSISTLNSSLSLWILTFSIPVGVGFAGLFSVGAVLQPLYFDRHIGLASGIGAGLGGVMTFFYPILWSTLVPSVGFNGTMYIFAGVIGSNVIPLLFLRRTPTQNTPAAIVEVNGDDDSASENIPRSATSINETSGHFSEISDDSATLIDDQPALSRCQRITKDLHFDVFRNRNYMVLSIGVALMMLGLTGASIHLLAFAALYFPNSNTYILTSVTGLCGAFSKLLAAVLVDFLPIKLSIYVLQVCVLLCSVILISVSFLMQSAQQFFIIVIFMSVYSVLESSVYVMPMPILFRFVPKESVPIAIAYQTSMIGIAVAIGPPFSGLLVGIFRSYALCFCLMPVAALVGVNLLFLTKC